MKTMKNLKMSLEPLHTLRLLYKYYLFNKDQPQVHKDQQPVRKGQLQVLILVMMMMTAHSGRSEDSEYGDDYSAQSQNS